MYAVEFNTKITDGKIEVPKEYLSELKNDVKVIILKNNNVKLDNENKKTKSVKGIFGEYANINLINKEKEAWGEAVIEKYVNN